MPIQVNLEDLSDREYLELYSYLTTINACTVEEVSELDKLLYSPEQVKRFTQIITANGLVDVKCYYVLSAKGTNLVERFNDNILAEEEGSAA